MTVFLNSNQTQKDIKVLNLISKYLYFIEYLVFFFFGVFYAKVSDQANYIAHFINEHIKLVETKSYIDTFSYCLLVCCTLVLVCLFFAFTLYGKYVLHILFSYVSLLLGIASASLYKIYLCKCFSTNKCIHRLRHPTYRHICPKGFHNFSMNRIS